MALLLPTPIPCHPPNPVNNPSYNNAEGATHNTTIRDTWQLAHEHYEEYKHMNAALVNRFMKLIPPAN